MKTKRQCSITDISKIFGDIQIYKNWLTNTTKYLDLAVKEESAKYDDIQKIYGFSMPLKTQVELVLVYDFIKQKYFIYAQILCEQKYEN